MLLLRYIFKFKKRMKLFLEQTLLLQTQLAQTSIYLSKNSIWFHWNFSEALSIFEINGNCYSGNIGVIVQILCSPHMN